MTMSYNDLAGSLEQDPRYRQNAPTGPPIPNLGPGGTDDPDDDASLIHSYYQGADPGYDANGYDYLDATAYDDGLQSPGIASRYDDRLVGDVDARRSARLHALDVARGIFLLISVGTASVVMTPMPSWLGHASWYGVTPYDLIFPVFMVLSGMGFAFAYKHGVQWGVTFRRAFVLFVVGIVYNAVHYQTYDPMTIRITGVLQLYAMITLIIGPLHLVLRNYKMWLLFTTLLTAGATYALHWWPAHRCLEQGLTYTCNPSAVIDSYVFGPVHMWNQGQFGHDPEGLVALVGALITASLGTTLGHFFVADSTFRALKAWRISQTPDGEPLPKTRGPWVVTPALITLYVALGGLGVMQIIPPFKRLWTPSFALLSGVFGMALVIILWVLIDKRGQGRTSWVLYPLVSLGRNALLVYFGSHLLVGVLARQGYVEAWGLAVWPAHPVLAFVGLSLMAWTVLAMILHRLCIYVHA